MIFCVVTVNATMVKVKKIKATCSSNAPAPSWMLIGALVILVLLAATLVYQYLVVARASKQEGFRAKKSESFDSGSMDAKLVFIYMNGCSWCEKFKPHWDQFVATYGPSLSTKGVELVSYERNVQESKQYNDYVTGYPTVLLSKGKSVTVFDGERTSEGLSKFMTQNGL